MHRVVLTNIIRKAPRGFLFFYLVVDGAAVLLTAGLVTRVGLMHAATGRFARRQLLTGHPE